VTHALYGKLIAIWRCPKCQSKSNKFPNEKEGKAQGKQVAK